MAGLAAGAGAAAAGGGSAKSPILSMAVNRLAVRSDRLAEVLRFYADVLGMQVAGNSACYGPTKFDTQGSTALQFIPVDPSAADRRRAGAYWKIGIGLPDVNAAVRQLSALGVQVNLAEQFLDVGFLTHMADPSGYTIELLQDTFEANFQPAPPCNLPLACEQPKVGQVTLRVSEIQASLGFYQGTLGMRLLCWYPVEKYGFQLHFLAFTDELPPDRDPGALINREWTYSRPYTTLELHSCPGKGQQNVASKHGELGWQGLEFGVSSLQSAEVHLAGKGLVTTLASDGCAIEVADPDGYVLRLVTVP